MEIKLMYVDETGLNCEILVATDDFLEVETAVAPSKSQL